MWADVADIFHPSMATSRVPTSSFDHERTAHTTSMKRPSSADDASRACHDRRLSTHPTSEPPTTAPTHNQLLAATSSAGAEFPLREGLDGYRLWLKGSLQGRILCRQLNHGLQFRDTCRFGVTFVLVSCFTSLVSSCCHAWCGAKQRLECGRRGRRNCAKMRPKFTRCRLSPVEP